MLFGPCAVDAGATFLPTAGALCGGGAGFVSAVVGALAAAGKTEPAKTLRGEVPVVDSVSVRVVTDNIVIQFVPNETRDGLLIERKSGNTHPDKPPSTMLNGESGLALQAEIQARRRDPPGHHRLRLHAGRPAQQYGNPQSRPGADRRHRPEPRPLRSLRRHGRLPQNARCDSGRKEELPFYVGGEDCFCWRRNPGGNFGALDRKAILDADLSLMLAPEPAIIADHAFTTGRIGQVSFETPLLPTTEIVGIFDGFGCYPDKMPAAKNTGQYIPDDFDHELATVYNVKDQGLVVLTSCSHRGVINTVRQAMAASWRQ